MRIAGFLHDLGKLAVPVEILDKPSGLVRNEYNVIRHHAFYTYRILDALPPLAVINKWAALHHERLDGKGYPFHLTAKELLEGSQIMAVADVFTAIAENRPYRAGMTRDSAIGVLDDMVRARAINGDIVTVLKKNYEEINAARTHAQAAATREYRLMNQKLKKPM
jgi:HD-GYP domain-containing protein (c-di-GMP phosphodiesterase class II)